ncbi:hypothetical protein ASPZODRAFT_134131 [Penicilliopsis zonata CBS 506.65]|uniref:C3HC-type domain-containing protein n=1 Tax=Penicilliopsis zonata CBS 506.65 TaxID=1073090 RepID=A0A1L9SE86_9EURO|nr:hypothetical protein ASPZODRAFT_134131 [Penicilliopsis zonata CBS 506.65]OJJ45472.1 hypothetical protein ASPZODRAFT_134131 [Penicilliopsis zonata CBS 506.65]
MSYAVESKKRKFHRVLESISKPLSADAANKQGPTTPTSRALPEHLSPNLSIKKVRVNGETDLPTVRDSLSKTGKPVSRVPSTASTASISAPRPSFVPWDRERFLERLETFRRVDRWSPKPTEINEVAWAKRGWICSGVMRVSCVSGCGGSVVVKLPDELDELDGYDSEKVQERKEVRAKLVEKYAQSLSEGHGDKCPWRNKGCDATIHRLDVTNPDIALPNLQKRYLNLAKMGDKLPARDAIEIPPGLDLEEIIKILPEGFQRESEEASHPESSDTTQHTESDNEHQERESAAPSSTKPTEINRAAFALAFFGWDSISDGAAGLAGCGACFRRLGLWMYKPKDNGDAGVYNTLDAANEHMEYCPWINGKTQSGKRESAEDSNGWKLLSRAIHVKLRRHLRSIASMDTLRTDADAASVDGSVVNDETQKTTDREWWAKLRRMRQVLNVRSPKRTKSLNP